MSDLLKIKELLEGLRHFIWLKDIPFPGKYEGMKYHESIKEILAMTDSVISEVDDMILGLEDDCK